MKISISKVAVLLLLTTALISCKETKNAQESTYNKPPGGISVGSPPVIIYKTRADYTDKVPVILNEDKTAITSYPAPSDVYYRGKLAEPVELTDEFLLDQRGIDQNVAFLDISYSEYSRLKKAPSADSLMKHIIDKDPLLIIYRCGNKNEYDNLQAQLNRMIEAGDLGRCVRLDK